MPSKNINKRSAPIHLIPGFHYDVIYLKSYKEYLDISCKIIEVALDILKAEADYTFTMEQVILLEEFWRLYPEKQNMIKQFVKEGRFDIAPAMYAMPDMNLIDGESMFMQAKVGKDWIKKYLDIKQDSCWIADCWGHHAQLPQILSQAGYKYYFFWRCMRRDVMENDFIWKGLDGSEIKTHWLATGYANLRFPSNYKVENALELDFSGVSPSNVNSLYDRITKYGESGAVLICNGGDFCTPQASATEIIKHLNASGKTPQIIFSSPTKYMDSLNWNKINTYDGEFNSAFQGTYTSNIRIKQYNHYLCTKIKALEKLSVLTGVKLDLTEEWKLLLKQQFHDTICGTICDSGLAETYSDFAKLEKLIDNKYSVLDDSKQSDAVFNPLSFERTEFICNDGQFYKATVPALQMKGLGNCQKIDNFSHPVSLPASFINDFYSVEIDKNAYITSLFESKSKQELVSNKICPFGSLTMQMDYGDLWLNFEGPLSGGSVEAGLTQNVPDPLLRNDLKPMVFRGTIFPVITNSTATEDDVGLTVTQQGFLDYWTINIPFEIKIEFSNISPVIKFKTKLTPSGKNFRIRAAFPTTIANEKISHEIPFGIQKRESYEYPAQSWVNYTEDNLGASLFNRGIPANNVDDGTMLLTLFRSVSMEYKTTSNDSFNIDVPHDFEYAFMPHSNIPVKQIIKEAHAFSNPLIFIKRDSIENEFNLTGNDNVYISAMRWNDDKIFIRLYEATGENAAVKLHLAANFSEYCITDGMGNPISDLSSLTLDNAIDLSFRPFEIKSLQVK